MSNPETFWFHCGRCGALFQSPAGQREDRVCARCGESPELGVESPPMTAAPTATANLPPARSDANHSHRRSKRHSGKSGSQSARRHNRLLLKIMAGWVVLLVLIILGARFLWHEEEAKPITTDPVPAVDRQSEQESIILVQKATPICAETMSSYLAATTQEAKCQFVLAPADTATRMNRFYGENPMERLDPANFTLAQQHVIDLPGGKGIETLWTTKDGRQIDALFRQEEDTWKLDWEHFVRYSDQPWALFLAGSGDAEGEFRLLARERLAKERKEAEDISLVLYAPRFGEPHETGYQSPEFNILRKSPEGKLLEKAFRNAREKKAVYQSALGDLNPDEMIRVRVRVKREDSTGPRKFTITRVSACHWYGIDDPGVTPDADEPKTPGSGK